MPACEVRGWGGAGRLLLGAVVQQCPVSPAAAAAAAAAALRSCLRPAAPCCPPELKRLAEAGVAFVESVAAARSGGLPARARTLAFCGYQGTVAYSMIGEVRGGWAGGR